MLSPSKYQHIILKAMLIKGNKNFVCWGKEEGMGIESLYPYMRNYKATLSPLVLKPLPHVDGEI